MALLNRPLTADEIAKLMNEPADYRKYTPFDWFEPRYQTVRYRAAYNRIDYERRDTFYALGPEHPSDSVWMVPCGIGALVDDARWQR